MKSESKACLCQGTGVLSVLAKTEFNFKITRFI